MSAEEWIKALIVSGIPRETAETFMLYHLENPQIWNAFRMLALKKINEGCKHAGAKQLMEQVRFEHEARSKGKFKVNNSWVSIYVRVFEIRYPKHVGFFETREIKGVDSETGNRAAA